MKIPHVPPRFKSKRAREHWLRVADDLVRHGLDPSARTELISDFVDAETTIASLRPQAKGSADVRLAQARALNNAVAERRRLHQRLFAGAKRLEEPLPQVEEVVEQIAATDQSDADEAWRDALWPAREGGRTPLDQTEIERRFGRPSWAALLHPTRASQAKDDLELEAIFRRRPSLAKSIGRRAA
ncbi:hypothetical protein FJ970_18015 [Mesorhizobium sp. B2-1-8]|uniref:hypothetical protein n=1 Tax=Mesorhizobium sp. B2-1-8 TaxID=2589967 RepID=UPI0011279F45|nr:hypothetical protein [Mesorhizobium sp. B2-1-8]UCI17029.1 hypothetical protein FJ970_18015 [Mesorhizobium sp. B2-1-8]